MEQQSYILVEANSAQELATKVSRLLDDGYIVHGSPSIIRWDRVTGSFIEGAWRFYQAVLLDVVEEKLDEYAEVLDQVEPYQPRGVPSIELSTSAWSKPKT